MSDERLTVPEDRGDEEAARTLRPRRLSEFVGQGHVREQLAVFLDAAAARGEPLDHVLLLGPPGPRQDDARAHHRRRDGRRR